MCISIVASAFQYGCAPTLMPATTTLISPPSWVNSISPRSTREIQSMFSVPESMAILAPAETANHSIGAVQSPRQLQRGEHPPALRFRDRAQCLGRVADEHDAGHPLRVRAGSAS